MYRKDKGGQRRPLTKLSGRKTTRVLEALKEFEDEEFQSTSRDRRLPREVEQQQPKGEVRLGGFETVFH